jgi:NADH-quinone oxidoreductase subunit L
MLEHIWLIPLLPLLGVVVVGGLGTFTNCVYHTKLNKKFAHTIAVGVIVVAFIMSAISVYELTQQPTHIKEVSLFTWIPGGVLPTAAGPQAFNIQWGYQLDPLSAVMILVVTGVGLLIHIYSMGYMWEETGYYRFFTYMNLFMCAMLTLVLANNFLVMFVGWEGVGLCSYLLIGYYFEKKSAGDAGKKAFIVNRIGDGGFIIGMMLTFVTFGSLDFTEVFAQVSKLPIEVGFGILSMITLALFVGATGKSAQLPLFVWLPDAMEGPTPVSALIHAATMVTAGVYMVTRCNSMFSRAPETMAIVAVIGVATALFAATIGLVQRDIKRVLAYSTVSQLGYMFVACGVGAFVAGIFHLMTHAFFKALLFLGSGSVIHGMHHEQDMMKMGGLKKYMPWTCRTMWVGTMAIAGVPLLSGFFSKDEILWKAFSSGHVGIWLAAWLAAGLTAFYMFRLMFLTFHGEERMDDHTKHHVHESPASMVAPLVILAGLSVVGGYIGLPAFMGHALHVGNYFEQFLEPVMQLPAAEAGAEHAGEAAMELLITGLSIAIAALGIYMAYLFYLRNKQLPDKLAASWPRVYELLYRKYKVDELYDALFVNRAKDLGRALGSFDHTFVDGAVNGTATTTRFTGTLSRLFDTYIVDGLVNLTGIISQYLGSLNRKLQTGIIPRYAMSMILGVIVFVGLYLITG